MLYFQIRRHEMEKHIKDNLQNHLNKACAKIHEITTDLREKTVRLNLYEEKLASLVSEQV